MTSQRFSVGQALSHWATADAPDGFMRKFVPRLALALAVITAISTVISWPIYGLYGELIADWASGEEVDFIAFSEASQQYNLRSGLAMLIVYPLQIGAWAVFESALQRRHIRGEAFSFRLGNDEGRIAVIGLIWFGFFIVAYISLIVGLLLVGLFMMIGILIHPIVGFVFGGIAFLTYLVFSVYIGTRFSAASALTIRDQKIAFFDSWRVTIGAGRSLLWSYLVLGLLYMVSMLVIYALGLGLGYASLGDLIEGGDRSDILQAMSSPSMFAILGITMLSGLVSYSFFHAAFAGPGALAAKTDPTWAGQAGIADEFS